LFTYFSKPPTKEIVNDLAKKFTAGMFTSASLLSELIKKIVIPQIHWLTKIMGTHTICLNLLGPIEHESY
jgi:hypothetical protein